VQFALLPLKNSAYDGIMTAGPRLALFTRLPVAGSAKTRLIPAVGAKQAASIHKTLTERTIVTLKQLAKASGAAPAEVHFTGGSAEDFSAWLGDDVSLVEQVGGSLGDRLVAAIDPAPVILFGADTPDLLPAHCTDAAKALSSHDLVIGPACDGGYYLIGVTKPFHFLFSDMPWSSDRLFEATLRRAAEHGLRCAQLEMLSDCDEPEDLERWPWLLSC
jgi:uncharacterized protein